MNVLLILSEGVFETHQCSYDCGYVGREYDADDVRGLNGVQI